MIPLSSEEVLSKRTRNAKHFKLGDGQYQAEISLADVHYESESNGWHDIDTTLFDEAEFDLLDFPVYKEKAASFKTQKKAVQELKKQGKLEQDSLDYHGLKVPFDAVLPRKFSKGYIIGKGKERLTFIPQNAATVSGYVSTVKPNLIAYENAWADTDVYLELRERGVKETIILKTDKAPVQFSFEVKGALTDELTSGELRLEPAWLEDANGERRDVAQTVRRENGKVYVDIAADVSGLVYPVEIDPTVTLQPPDGTGIYDTYVTSGSPDSGMATQTSLYVGFSAGVYRTRMYFKFDMGSVPVNSVVSNAVFSLVKAATNGTSTDTFYVHEVLANWAESVTYNTQPSYNATASASLGPKDNSAWSGWDWSITGLAQKWVNGNPNYGFLIKNGETMAMETVFYSSEDTTAANRPKLVINYNPVPTAPTVTAPNGGETWNALHRISWQQAEDPGAALVGNNTNMDAAWYLSGAGGQVNAVMQRFTPASNSTRVDAVKFIGSANSPGTYAFTIEIWQLDNSDVPLSLIRSYNSSVTTTSSSDRKVVAVAMDAPINPSNRYGVVIRSGANMNVHGTNTSLPPGIPGYIKTQMAGATNWVETSPFWLSVEVSMSQSLNLQYQVMLSPDGGVTWSLIVATATGTSVDYDFTNEPQTSTAKVRIRAYDGAGYGPWDESNGVFTIQHNASPNAPTHKYISANGSTINKKPKFFFTVSDPDAANTITDMRIQVDDDPAFGTPIWDRTALANWDDLWGGIPAFNGGIVSWVPINYLSDLTPGNWYVRAQSQDNSGVWSAWSAGQQFSVAAAPWTDTVPADGAGFKGQWLNDLGNVINNIRQFRGLAAATFTDGTLDNTKDIKAAHVTERRTNLEAVLSAVGVTPPAWTDTTLNNTSDRKGVHVKELRNAVLSDDWITFNEGWDNGCPYPKLTTTVNSVTNGILNVTSTTGDPGIEMYNLGSFDPNVYRYLEMRYRIVSGGATDWQVFVTNTTYPVANGAMAVTTGAGLIADAQWHTAVMDLWTNANYKTGGRILGWRLDWATTTGVNMEIDYVRLRK